MLDGIVGHPDLFSVCEVSGKGDIVEVGVNNKKIFGKAIKGTLKLFIFIQP